MFVVVLVVVVRCVLLGLSVLCCSCVACCYWSLFVVCCVLYADVV